MLPCETNRLLSPDLAEFRHRASTGYPNSAVPLGGLYWRRARRIPLRRRSLVSRHTRIDRVAQGRLKRHCRHGALRVGNIQAPSYSPGLSLFLLRTSHPDTAVPPGHRCQLNALTHLWNSSETCLAYAGSSKSGHHSRSSSADFWRECSKQPASARKIVFIGRYARDLSHSRQYRKIELLQTVLHASADPI